MTGKVDGLNEVELVEALKQYWDECLALGSPAWLNQRVHEVLGPMLLEARMIVRKHQTIEAILKQERVLPKQREERRRYYMEFSLSNLDQHLAALSGDPTRSRAGRSAKAR